MNIKVFRAASDNYMYLLWQDKAACVIDPTDAAPIALFIQQNDLTLGLILNTHHHLDHCSGNAELKKRFGCPVMSGSSRTPQVDQVVANGTTLAVGKMKVSVLATPGHTRDSVCFHLADNPGKLFTGDTLFVLGCGRIFEGTANDLWNSFQKILQLPDETEIYSGHDYTADNLAFALFQEPANLALQTQQKALTAPSTLREEKQFNPFLRASGPDKLAALRQQKDHF